MKKINIIYWTSTIVFAILMILSAFPSIMLSKDSVQFMNGLLHYPDYFTQFLGVAKTVGGIAILIPGKRIFKEWAYAGLAFDLIGAAYSIVICTGFNSGVLMLFGWILPGVISYIYYQKKYAV